MKVRMLLAGGFLVLAVSVARSGDWPQFRGPDGTGVIDDPKLPAEWDAKKNVAWKASVPGVAWSCPIVVGDKVFVTTAITDKQQKPKGGFGGGFGPPGGGGGGGGGGFGPGMKKAPDAVYKWRVLCLDKATGKILWDQTASEAKPKSSIHASNTYATETPVSDGERVYAYFGNTGLYCYDLAGKQLWKKDLGSYSTMFGHGTGSSPVLHDGKVFIQCDNEEKSFLVALDAKTGDEKWKVSRPDKTAWCTPFVWKTKDRTDLVVGGSQKVRGYDPATGKVVWELAVAGGYCESSPVGDSERLYFGLTPGPSGGGGGFGRPPGGGGGGGGGPPGGMRFGGGGLYAIKAGATGDISLKGNATSNAGVAWSTKTGTSAPSPLAYQGYLYVLSQQGGMMTCYDAKTGEAKYSRERIPQAKSFWASPWAANGNIFCLDEDGVTHVLKAGPEFDVIGKNALARETYWATPAIAGGALFVRGVDTLYCIK
jgi:outer membrane protein assembly factor BamB